jgi:DNA-binding transcriptional ArsR family regulator
VESDLTTVARAIADPTRSAMLLRLMDGRRHTARELADATGVSPSAASPHLRRLVEAGLVSVHVMGRQRLHALASPQVATAIEALAAVSPLLPVESLRTARTGSRLQTARVCYSHLGGALAVTIARRLEADGALDDLGHPLLAALGITDLSGFAGPRVRTCTDWTEQETHLAGRLGSALLAALLDRDWLRRRPRDRALNITEAGAAQLAALGIPLIADLSRTGAGADPPR